MRCLSPLARLGMENCYIHPRSLMHFPTYPQTHQTSRAKQHMRTQLPVLQVFTNASQLRWPAKCS
jgi:hypothetical protein